MTPDPERWFPMKERSYYRGKKKGKKKDQIGKGTQGATAGASAELWVNSAVTRTSSRGVWVQFPVTVNPVINSTNGGKATEIVLLFSCQLTLKSDQSRSCFAGGRAHLLLRTKLFSVSPKGEIHLPAFIWTTAAPKQNRGERTTPSTTDFSADTLTFTLKFQLLLTSYLQPLSLSFPISELSRLLFDALQFLFYRS